MFQPANTAVCASLEPTATLTPSASASISNVSDDDSQCQSEFVQKSIPNLNSSINESEKPETETDTVIVPNPDTQMVQVSADPAEWVIIDATIDYLLSNKIEQNIMDFSATKTFYPAIQKHRYLTKNVLSEI